MSGSSFQPAQAVPSRRRPPREHALTYRIQVVIEGSDPPIWRSLELSSDLTLDLVHQALQTVLGWTDSHLHDFASGEDPTDRLAERYRMQYSIDDGLDGIDETTVRLDEVLVEPGDQLFYTYDFGDDWTHLLQLEAVTTRGPDVVVTQCLDGARACPPEDCGGIWGYQQVLAALANPDEANADLREWVGPDFDPDHFSVDEVNIALRRVEREASIVEFIRSRIDQASPLGSLLARMDPIPADLAQAISVAMQTETPIGHDTKKSMLHRYSWFLDLVGDAGVTLTQAGYLPPALVQATSSVLNLDDLWIGKNNREIQTYPVLEFRESAQQLGLLRKSHNRLLPTKAGARGRTDVDSLWRTICAALPLRLTTHGPEAHASHDAGLLLLVAIAAALPVAQQQSLVALGLRSLGWRTGPVTDLSDRDIGELLRPNDVVLRHLGALPERTFVGPPAPHDPVASAAFARATLRL